MTHKPRTVAAAHPQAAISSSPRLSRNVHSCPRSFNACRNASEVANDDMENGVPLWALNVMRFTTHATPSSHLASLSASARESFTPARRVYSTAKIRDFRRGRCPGFLSDGPNGTVAAAVACPRVASTRVGEGADDATYPSMFPSIPAEEIPLRLSGFGFESLGKCVRSVSESCSRGYRLFTGMSCGTAVVGGGSDRREN